MTFPLRILDTFYKGLEFNNIMGHIVPVHIFHYPQEIRNTFSRGEVQLGAQPANRFYHQHLDMGYQYAFYRSYSISPNKNGSKKCILNISHK